MHMHVYVRKKRCAQVEIENQCADEDFVHMLHKTYAEKVSWKDIRALRDRPKCWVECTCAYGMA